MLADPAPRQHTLAFHQPGHFHAAMTLKDCNPRIRTTVHLYAAPSPDRAAFLSLVDSFNGRADNPTSWEVQLHGDDDAAEQLAALIADGLADVVVLAGKNVGKLDIIAALVEVRGGRTQQL